ncbi:gametocyte-specific factor 1 homolog isoform X2 [Eurytemora carolleeae]|uniref:gametocyte-specific factor 1 homolog isoform X2 n=1 Tax=Eurytemora carolleeae TaxID=1294199 RepID=UPI000C79422D|nr:gametocyte-specific factor 1 homolog isoform X2 [Eurytemora carolleeae]|eukprot:XP_023320792.1 gametocyte-specific factor 1 homolog isoform X2 [Eurytemora affinis]
MEEQLESCPYNPAHTIRRSKLQYHIVKCSRSFPAGHLATCEYNATHLFKKEQMEEHYLTCPSRAQVMVEYEERRKSGCLALPRPSSPPQLVLDEDWGEEADRSNRVSYDPQKAIEKRMVLRSLPNSTRSQRNEFKKAEKERLSNLQEQMEKEMEKEKMETNRVKEKFYGSSAVTSVASHGAGGGLLSYYSKMMKKN